MKHMLLKQHYHLKAIILATAVISYTAAGPAVAQAVISGPTPFAGCNVAMEPGTNFLNAEVEPWVDANPANPNNLIAGWQQDRWSNGGARSVMSAYSTDGGATWNRVVINGINKCTNGTGNYTYDRSTDPWITFSPNGHAYYMGLSFNNDRPDGGGGFNEMWVAKSTDGGATWSAPVELKRDTDGRAFNDKNAITANPFDSNYVYAVWDRLFDNTLPESSDSDRSHGDGVMNARDRRIRNLGGNTFNTVSFTGPTWFARTTNGGQSWEPARMILDTGPNGQTIGNLVAVLPGGPQGSVVYNFFTHIYRNGKVSLGFMKSLDRGATFGPEQTAQNINVTLFGTATPDDKAPVRDANILFDVAADPANGNLYLVWQDGRLQNVDRVFFSMSRNGGGTWTAPVMIAKTPYSTNKLRMQSFVPSVEVGANSRVYVTYYDFRNDKKDGKEATDYWSVTCNGAAGTTCANAANWGNERRLTTASFNMLNAPVARGHFLGDYMGLVKQSTGVRAVFGIATGPNLNEMVTALIP